MNTHNLQFYLIKWDFYHRRALNELTQSEKNSILDYFYKLIQDNPALLIPNATLEECDEAYKQDRKQKRMDLLK